VALGIHLSAAAFGLKAFDGEPFGFADLEGPEDRIQIMTGHVADRTRAEISPVAPIERVQIVMILAKWGGPDPLIPMQAGGDRFTGWPAAVAAEVTSEQGV